MFKFTIAIAALAVSAALAVNVPEQPDHRHQMYRAPQQQQRQQAQTQHQQQQQQQYQRDPMVAAASGKQKPEKVVYVTEVRDASYGVGDVAEMLESAAFKLIKAPKKAVGAVAALIVGKLKSLNAKGLLKAALLAGLVAVIGAVAAVVTISVAGLVAAVTGVCAAVLHFKHYLGGGGDVDGGRAAEEAQIDYVADFVLGAFDKYGEKH